MTLDIKELKEIQYDFNSISDRLLHADYSDYTSVLKKFIAFLRNTDIIISYIEDCGVPVIDPKNEVEEVVSSFGGKIFTTGDTDEEEVRNVFSVLAYIADNNLDICYAVTLSYNHVSKYFQDGIRAFNDRFVMVLIGHLDRYLKKIGIKMGLDDNAEYNISVTNGIVNVASDNASINAQNTINDGIDQEKLFSLMEEVKQSGSYMCKDDVEKINNSLEMIKEEMAKSLPQKNRVKKALKVLNTIKGSMNFMATVATLVQFIAPVL